MGWEEEKEEECGVEGVQWRVWDEGCGMKGCGIEGCGMEGCEMEGCGMEGCGVKFY